MIPAPSRVQHPQRLYLRRVRDALGPDTAWLDVGCGRALVPEWVSDHEAVERQLTSRPASSVGIDLDIAALRDHTAHRSRLQASAVSLPFSSCAFDLVTSNMVFEHLDRPWDALAEIRRVLRPGGRLIVHTPNLFDIVSLAAWTIPSSLHARLVSAVETRTAEDVYPTYFRFNYRPRIRGWLGMAGFRRCQVSYLECPDVYGHVPVVARVESIWHTVARHVPALRGTVLIDATV